MMLSLPTPKEHADFALLTSPEGEFWLAYELERDFLSAPRCFAVLNGSLGAEGQMAWLQPAQEPAEDFLVFDNGLYFLSLSNAQQELRLAACTLKLIETLYHQQGPQAALLTSLNRIEG
ncbi:MAG: hypothetical protein RL497_1712 [Pseudomonadota bacterium]|jgi:hypothetical protein